VEVGNYCGGVIKGSGIERFCGRLRNECAVQSHRAQTVSLQGNRLYIRAPRGEQVMSENSLNVEPLPVESVTKMLELSKPINLWVAYFLSLANAPPREEYTLLHEREVLGSALTDSSWEEVGILAMLEDFERTQVTL
jgi:hypothetical protein